MGERYLVSSGEAPRGGSQDLGESGGVQMSLLGGA